MNYTGRPSISGCRPVLPLYPTHRFCQYLLLIFITFTNSSLFNRAFSTNSRRPLRRAEGVTVPGLNLSVTADAVPPPLPRGGLGIAENFSSSPEAPLLGATATTAASGGNREELLGPRPAGCEQQRSRRWEPQPGLGERSETERLYEGEPFLLASPVSFWRNVWYNGFAVHPAYLTGEEVDALAYFLTFLVSVGADVVSHFICKWLDRYEENRKA